MASEKKLLFRVTSKSPMEVTTHAVATIRNGYCSIGLQQVPTAIKIDLLLAEVANSPHLLIFKRKNIYEKTTSHLSHECDHRWKN